MQSCSAIVLAGGRATRLGGANKALLEVGGRRIVDRVLDSLRPLANQILVVGHLADGTGLANSAGLAGVEVLPDLTPSGGTLAAIHTGLLAARNEVVLVVGCDMPFLSTPLLRRIATLSEGYDLAVPRVGPYLEALHAAYHRSCLPAMELALRRGEMKIIDFYPRVRVREVSEREIRAIDPDLRSFLNVNTPADLERARTMAGDPSNLPAPSVRREGDRGDSYHPQHRETVMPPIVSVVGRSDAGKTTFLEKLIPALKARGIRVAVVKHDRHGFEMDRPGKDTWRLRQAGADAVMISAPNQLALIRSGLEREATLDELAALVGDAVDLVLTEGYKSGDRPKIEVSRRAVAGGELLCTREELLAVVADSPRPVDVPHFDLEDAAGVADLLVRYLGRAS